MQKRHPKLKTELPGVEPRPPKRRQPARPIAQTKPARGLGRRATKSTALLITLLLVLSAGYVGLKFAAATLNITGGGLFGLFGSNQLNESQGRVNILLAGNSADDPGHGGADLTDSIMVVSLDTVHHTAVMLSIPRDLWVNIPGHGYAKINSAYPDGGMPLLEQVVSENFGININYYALADYAAFRDAVNDVGGIDVNIQSSDPRGIYDPNITAADHGPLILQNGLDHLDGQTALNLARARNDPTPSGQVGYGLANGDFDRAKNQRLMLVAIKDKVFSTSVLANPIKLGGLFDSLGSNLKTDFRASQLPTLYSAIKQINSNNIKSVSLTDQSLVQSYVTADGQDALIPSAGLTDFSQVQAFVQQQISNNPVVQEGATAVILNGSGISGLAQQEETSLKTQGIDVTNIATASTAVSHTTLIDNSNGSKPATLSYLNQKFSPLSGADTTLAKNYGVNFVIILGPDASGK